MKLTKKQTIAIDILQDDKTEYIIFGGGAGSAKSFLGAYWVIKNCLKYAGTTWLVGRKEGKALKRTTLKTIFEVCKVQGVLKDIHYVYREQQGEINFFNGSQILLYDLAFQPSDPEYDNLGSLELTGAFIDEVNQIPSIAWNVVKSRLRYKIEENGLIPTILGTCNPSKGWVYKEYYKPWKEGKLEPTKQFIQALVTDNPFIDKHYVNNLRQLPKQQRDRLLNGVWETDDDPNILIQYDNILNLFTNTHVRDENANKFITCDVARMGSDKAVIFVWQGFEVIDMVTYEISKITELADEITKLKNKYSIPNSNIVADEDGVGGGLIDILKIKGFINNSKAIGDENYQNLKTQCYYKLSEMIERNEIYFSTPISTKVEEEIIEELEQIKAADNDNDGKLKIVSKNTIKMSIGRSPDYSDALMLRMFFEIGVKRPEKHLGIITSRFKKQLR
jgi:PBSX family phage terminase large subunit